MDQYTPDSEQHQLSDELDDMIRYEQASQGQRSLNYIIDALFIQFGVNYLVGWPLGFLLGTYYPELTQELLSDTLTVNYFLVSYAIGVINILLYYTICEKAFKGYTLGKLATGTRAVREDGGELTFKDALLRSLSRCVPFEVLSGFGERPWHDIWPKTWVIKTR